MDTSSSSSSLGTLFQRVREDIANNVRFEVDPSSITAGPQTVTITGVTERVIKPKELRAGANTKTLSAVVFSVLTSEGVPLDSAFDFLFEPGKESPYSRRILGFILASCGISDPACLKGAKAHVRLAQKPYPNGGSGWVIANWGIPQPGGTYLWMYDKAREAHELTRHLTDKQPAAPPRPTVPIDPPAVPPPETGSLPDMAMDFISGLDDPLGGPVS